MLQFDNGLIGTLLKVSISIEPLFCLLVEGYEVVNREHGYTSAMRSGIGYLWVHVCQIRNEHAELRAPIANVVDAVNIVSNVFIEPRN